MALLEPQEAFYMISKQGTVGLQGTESVRDRAWRLREHHRAGAGQLASVGGSAACQ
jgi:hypothetical protein